MSTSHDSMTTERLQQAWKESHDALRQNGSSPAEKSQPTYVNRAASAASDSDSDSMTTERLQQAWKESHDALRQ